MPSTFHGLEVGKRGMTTQQAALYTTGHNIANANTPGYSRQRVNFVQTEPYPPASMNRPQIPGQMGTGVQAGSIQRIRDSFIDDQYRGENNKLGYWEAKRQALSSMEAIMNEPTEQGLANTLDQFWSSLQDLSVTPQDSGARSVVRQRGIAVSSTFNYAYNSLKAVQEDYKTEIDITQKSINSILNQINQVNQQIGDVEVHGYLPNDLYDQRDRLVDELSTYINIRVEPQSSGGASSPIAEGQYDIYLADNNGNRLLDGSSKPIKLVSSAFRTAYGVYIKYDSSSDQPVNTLQFFELDPSGGGFGGFAIDPAATTSAPDYTFSDFQSFASKSTGSLKAHIETYGYLDGTQVKGQYPDMMANLDEMAYTFAREFNNIHRSGWSITEINANEKDGKDFFSFAGLTSPPFGAAKYLQVSEDILTSTDNIAAAAEGTAISAIMAADSGNAPATDGFPEIRGLVEFSSGSAQLEIEVTFDGTDWNYSIGSENGTLSVSSGIAEFPEYPGLIIDVSEVQSMAGAGTPDKWTLSVPNNGGIKPGDEAFIGDGSNAAALANVKDAVLTYGTATTTVTGFYQSVIGDMGVKAAEASRMTKNAAVLKDSVLSRRESVSSVSLDEEMTNMIKFQHAYNAAARTITMVDEMLDKIINSMGLVGR
ncbi:hypothetical protein ABE29_18735 [Cytobacillus firmus]|uniref:flagellar hook-associated protein FlgK n=1 Tax=Cytobacillus firmus TaxID=1399 RepID=UPI00077CA59E|nr:flagellar hook-associated protein FlgK [Cytobacillus firmus]MBG9544719.1 hypothetical protein [Cytobacillus firmus]MBG9554002.1 hypothetical protein [Cytobacillus firmus]MBG9558466.1 hypothetical protein [Cytobacillus firmus]MBG9576991.1 hypothetical protein [Cytobacillus firmus]MEC1894358.1 flagellar hook-associated protein FlgK [Cytobacillus firmus]